MSTQSLPIVDNKLKVKAVTYLNKKTPLTIKEIDIPVVPGEIIKPTELLVQVKATSINPVDCVFKGMNNGWFTKGDRVIGGDFAGLIVKAGSETNFKEGDRIYGDILTIKLRGSFSEYIIFEPATAVICEKIPEGMKYEEAGSLPIASGTSYQCLNCYKGNLEGKNVLILGAGTSVGTYAVQFAKHFFKAGNVVATCSSKSAEKITKCGADILIDYTKGDRPKINELLEFVKVNGKFDIIVDTVRDEIVMDYFNELLQTYDNNGILTQVGGSYVIDYTNITLYNMLPSYRVLSNKIKFKLGLSKYYIEPILLHQCDTYGKAVETLYKQNKFIFSIDSIKDAYTQAEEAYQRVASGKAAGKVVVKWY